MSNCEINGIQAFICTCQEWGESTMAEKMFVALYLAASAGCPFGSLREKYPSTEFFLVRIQEDTDQKKLGIWTLFTQWMSSSKADFGTYSAE